VSVAAALRLISHQITPDEFCSAAAILRKPTHARLTLDMAFALGQ